MGQIMRWIATNIILLNHDEQCTMHEIHGVCGFGFSMMTRNCVLLHYSHFILLDIQITYI